LLHTEGINLSHHEAYTSADFKAAYSAETLTTKSFSSIEYDDLDLEKDEGIYLYAAAKAIAEKKIWEIAHHHPDVDITVSECCRDVCPLCGP
jgi:hypothetical protein